MASPLPPGELLMLADLITPTAQGIASRVLARTAAGNITLFAFDAGKSSKSRLRCALVLILSGRSGEWQSAVASTDTECDAGADARERGSCRSRDRSVAHAADHAARKARRVDAWPQPVVRIPASRAAVSRRRGSHKRRPRRILERDDEAAAFDGGQIAHAREVHEHAAVDAQERRRDRASARDPRSSDRGCARRRRCRARCTCPPRGRRGSTPARRGSPSGRGGPRSGAGPLLRRSTASIRRVRRSSSIRPPAACASTPVTRASARSSRAGSTGFSR